MTVFISMAIQTHRLDFRPGCLSSFGIDKDAVEVVMQIREDAFDVHVSIAGEMDFTATRAPHLNRPIPVVEHGLSVIFQVECDGSIGDGTSERRQHFLLHFGF